MDTNLKGMFLLAPGGLPSDAQARPPAARSSTSASILGLRQAGGVLPYAVSKAGAIQLTKTLALEVARFGIRVNALAPGYIETDLNKVFWESEAGHAMLRRIPQRTGSDNCRIWMGRCCCWQAMPGHTLPVP